MKPVCICLAVLCIAMLMVAPTHAAFVDLRIDGFSFSSDGTAYVPDGGDLTLDVWITGESDPNLAGYSFDIWYDTSEGISFTDGLEIEPSGWFSFSLFQNSAPFVQGIEAVQFVPNPPGTSIDQPLQVASLNFSYDPLLLVEDDQADFEVFYRAGQELTFVGPVFDSPGSVSADLIAPVPVPAAVWLLGSGLLGLVAIRRKQS